MTSFTWDPAAPEAKPQMASALSSVVNAINAGGEASDEKTALLANAAVAAAAAAVAAGVPLEGIVYGVAALLAPETQAFAHAVQRNDNPKPSSHRAQRASVLAHLGIVFSKIPSLTAGHIASHFTHLDGPGLVSVGAVAANVAGNVCQCRLMCPACQANDLRSRAGKIFIPAKGSA